MGTKRKYYYIRIKKALAKAKGFRVTSGTSETMEHSEVLNSTDAVVTHIIAMCKCWNDPLIILKKSDYVDLPEKNQTHLFRSVNKLALEIPRLKFALLETDVVPDTAAQKHRGYIVIKPVFLKKKKTVEFMFQSYGANHEPLEHSESLQTPQSVTRHIVGMMKCYSDYEKLGSAGACVVDPNVLSEAQKVSLYNASFGFLRVVVSRPNKK